MLISLVWYDIVINYSKKSTNGTVRTFPNNTMRMHVTKYCYSTTHAPLEERTLPFFIMKKDVLGVDYAIIIFSRQMPPLYFHRKFTFFRMIQYKGSPFIVRSYLNNAVTFSDKHSSYLHQIFACTIAGWFVMYHSWMVCPFGLTNNHKQKIGIFKH